MGSGSEFINGSCHKPPCLTLRAADFASLRSLAADATVMRLNRLTRSRLMHFQPDSPGPAGFALPTPGDSRRGRCEKRTGAVNAMFHHAAVHTAALHVGITSSSPAPRRFAPPAARLSSRRSSVAPARSLASGSGFSPSLARPCSAHAPGRSSVVFLSVLVEPSAIVLSSSALAVARVARRESPVGSTHAQRLSSTSVVSRSAVPGAPHNPACSGLRFATLARR